MIVLALLALVLREWKAAAALIMLCFIYLGVVNAGRRRNAEPGEPEGPKQ